MEFSKLNLDEQLLESMSYMGFKDATPIQEQAIPVILSNKDLIACAQTGTGKTGAFVLPILNKLIDKTDTSTNTIIIVPTRELAIQIEQLIQGLAYFTSISSIAIYGGGDGKDWDTQKNALSEGTDIIVATPGKLLSFMKQNHGDFSKVQHLIYDEADRMLDMGFAHDLEAILSHIPKERQTLLFSATMPPNIKKLASHMLVNPEEIKLAISKPAEGVTQTTYLCFDNQKNSLIRYTLAGRPDYKSIVIFSSSKSKVSSIVKSLTNCGIPAKGISSDFDQKEREEVLRAFSSKRLRVLVGTDVISRGIDVKDINLVINYDVPHDAEDYVHRIGRTARANTKGEAITFINEPDMFKFKKIEDLIEMEIEKQSPPELIGEGPSWNPKKIHKKPRSNNKKHYKKKTSAK